ncbi:NUDIX domain-containing protein [Ferruginibacter lapsinanis]|uniref:NUDIX hydrolase n=1 Tax=Ferruginibacter lapsinanis TaxID=563172 RepID=UPI001E2C43D6|nr:NUDIX domain-containing protein [Ferruginibacter lapsinanis]UEG49593.1 NUDIX domain-containing protein [Ferruginibacter lapsinanis]
MYIKIYFNDKPVFLCDEINAELKEILHHPDAVLVDEISSNAINALLHEIKKDEFHAGVLFHEDLQALKKSFFKHFTLIEAAGGIVQNARKELLFIYRLDKWDLPKGKMEAGESAEECAVREVEEETGVKNIHLKNKLGETYHTYNAYGKHYLKITHWFFMTCPNGQILVPQTEEDIVDIKWINTVNIGELMENTYPSIRDVVSIYSAIGK